MSEEETSYKATVQSILITFGLITALATSITWAFNQWSRWYDIPDRVDNLSANITSLESSISSLQETLLTVSRGTDPVDVLGELRVVEEEVRAGEPIHVVFHARANVSCERTIEVRFFSYERRSYIAGIRIDPAVRASFSQDYQLLVIPIKTFPGMSPGKYSYQAEAVFENCGGFRRQTFALSSPFWIIEDDEDVEGGEQTPRRPAR